MGCEVVMEEGYCLLNMECELAVGRRTRASNGMWGGLGKVKSWFTMLCWKIDLTVKYKVVIRRDGFCLMWKVNWSGQRRTVIYYGA